ncbi:hypothetical protein SAMN05421678_107267 [Actinopolymorpha cephalotaxi]|uniref:Uncharacterized protein n=1 Tax=Actinopolymorpha cephalotaxi TaxID=504797 RepID=A0A1I2TNL7_9ACTN|nr:hypothetical protein [Actinopolymorpha cephalotaxi]NYH83160.1 hypothetical protein [Actinopolymorpha cephalotaxi]SFG66504.1 hypothetical protein SAMN05421678_107267 [Actinopolymorpha cephalotaxi]
MSSINEVCQAKSEFGRKLTALFAEIDAALDLLSRTPVESLTPDERREVLEQLNYIRAQLDAVERKLLEHAEAHGFVLPRPGTEPVHEHVSRPGVFAARTGGAVVRP